MGALMMGLARLGLPALGPVVREFAVEFVSPRFFYEFFADEVIENWQGAPPELGWLYFVVGLFYLAVLLYAMHRFRFLEQLRQGWAEFRRRGAEARRAKAERLRSLKAAEELIAGVSYEAFQALAEGNRAFDEGRYDDALAAYEAAAGSTPCLSAPWVGRGAVLGRLGLHKEAQEAFRRALDLEPSNAEALVNLGLAAMAAGDPPGGARRAFLLAVEADPSSARGHYGLALLAAAGGDVAEVLAHLKRALRLSPSLVHEASREPAFASLDSDGCLRALMERFSPKATRLRRTG